MTAYNKITYDSGSIDRFLVDHFLSSKREVPKEITLDLDATDVPIYGDQQDKFYQGYYGHYCYLPLYITCDDFILCARLRPSTIDAPSGWEDELPRIAGQIRKRWPDTRIVIRADSGFCRDALLAWCEANNISYVIGLAKNYPALHLARIEDIFAQAAMKPYAAWMKNVRNRIEGLPVKVASDVILHCFDGAGSLQDVSIGFTSDDYHDYE